VKLICSLSLYVYQRKLLANKQQRLTEADILYTGPGMSGSVNLRNSKADSTKGIQLRTEVADSLRPEPIPSQYNRNVVRPNCSYTIFAFRQKQHNYE
jgi:hypothetical protein